jgi:hypothetical protein
VRSLLRHWWLGFVWGCSLAASQILHQFAFHCWFDVGLHRFSMNSLVFAAKPNGRSKPPHCFSNNFVRLLHFMSRTQRSDGCISFLSRKISLGASAWFLRS